jgi:hypothetical protein
MTPELETRIRNLAHRFWEEEGRPEGREAEHWRRAQEKLSGDEVADPAQASPATGSGRGAEGRGGQARQASSPVAPEGDPDGAQSGMTKEEVFLGKTTRRTPD